MATIKEVAALAQVSVGTVSNVLNGKTDNLELTERVEQVIRELGYRPDAKARSLKNTKTRLIGVMMPNLEHPRLAGTLNALEKELRRQDYSLLLKLSEDNPILEQKGLDFFLEQKADGIIIYPCQKKKHAYTRLLREKVPVVFLERDIALEPGADFVAVDYAQALAEGLTRLRELNHQQIGLILERDFISQSALAACCQRFSIPARHVKLVDFRQESGFKAAYELLDADKMLSAMFTSNDLLAKGALKAAAILAGLQGQNLPVIAVKEENWIEDENRLLGTIPVSCSKLGEAAVQKILNAIERPQLHEPAATRLEIHYAETKNLVIHSSPPVTNHPAAALTLCLFDSPAAHALKRLTHIYEQETGIKVTFQFLNYFELEDRLYQSLQAKRADFDAFMMDLTWVEDLVETNSVQALDGLIPREWQYFDDFIHGLSSEYGCYRQQQFGLPFMPGAQLLFYKKDLFEDRILKREFQRKYRIELQPPATWAEFNLAAEFFTRQYNDKSPVKYGASLARGNNIYSVIDFLNRLWAYGGDVFDQGKIVIDNEKALAALCSYTRSLKYSSLARPNQSWDELVTDFKLGDVAMTVLYDSHAVTLNDYSSSKVAGNVGYSLIPGRSPVLGGWSLALNKHSANKQTALDYVLWACGSHTAIPFSLLGGTTAREPFYQRRELDSLYPWKAVVLESYQISRKRIIPAGLPIKNKHKVIYEEIIGEELGRLISGQQDEAATLAAMEARLRTCLP